MDGYENWSVDQNIILHVITSEFWRRLKKDAETSVTKLFLFRGYILLW